MSEAQADDLVPVVIDDEEIRVPKGTNAIEAAALAGKEIPHYCYHPKLSVVGNCRMCLIELGMPGRDRATGEPMLNEDGSPKIMFMPRPAIACSTTVAPNMHIKTDSQLVRDCRNGVMEFLLVNHPLDCPICDQAGECRLQEFATDYGRGYSRFVEQKVVKPKRTRLGSRVMLDDERCILCSRCIRFCQEVAQDDVLGFIDRGSYSTLTCFPGKTLENNYSLNTVDICPVGALTSTDFRFKMRVWFLKETPGIDTESSVGVNTSVWSREGRIYRITPRRNDAVNDTWMADSGRALYKMVESDDRLTGHTVDGTPAPVAEAVRAAGDLLSGAQSVAIVTNGRASVEEQWLLKEIRDQLKGATVRLVSHTGDGDDLLVSADRTPNVRGALVTGLATDLPVADLGSLAESIESGEIDALLVVNEDLTAAGFSRETLGQVRTVFLGSHCNATSETAEVVLAGLTVFEKSGSFINQQFRLQAFAQAVPGSAGLVPDVAVLTRLLGCLRDEEAMPGSVRGVWAHLARDVELLADTTFESIPGDGLLLDGSAFAHLAFCEGKSLKYDPAPAEAAAG